MATKSPSKGGGKGLSAPVQPSADLAPIVGSEPIPRSEVLDEFCAAIAGKPPLHSGEWSLATMEVCLAMQQSAREGRGIRLQHQVPVLAVS